MLTLVEKDVLVFKVNNLKDLFKDISVENILSFLKNCWIPSHIGIYGNEKVDKSAKESLNLEVTDFKIPFNNFKPFINKDVCNKWQTLWDETPFNKLKEIEPIVYHHRLVPKLSRREEIVLARLRIGHTRVTHSCLLKREERPYCIGCDAPFTVRHFL